MSILKEFREFALKGNMIDMAVGIIIGGAFGKVVTSLVNDVIMPPIGTLVGNVDFSGLSIPLREAAEGKTEVLLRYGAFINTLVDFLIVAAAIFVVVKAMNTLRRKNEEKPAEPAAPTPQEKLLTEIRDLLKSRS
ncbi:MAG: large-conductance mechanosensitive channel protein MscL [Pirellulales bacterium]|nr:large-conductance mechanosensitive channel protein MscL [Pirellulales bacterium]